MSEVLQLSTPFESSERELSRAELEENAEHMATQSRFAAAILRDRIIEQTQYWPQDHKDAILEQYFETGEASKGVWRYRGVYETDGWLRETAWAMCQGKPVILMPKSFAMRTWLDQGKYRLDTTLNGNDEMSISLGKLLRDIAPPTGETKLLHTLDDHRDPASGRLFSDSTRARYFSFIQKTLADNHVIRPQDRAGKDYLITAAGDQPLLENELIANLRQSAWGTVVDRGDRSVTFLPEPEMLSLLPSKLTDKQREQYLRHGAFIRIYGEDTSTAQRAAIAAKTLRTNDAMLLALNQPSYEEHNDMFIFMKALQSTNIERFRSVQLAENLQSKAWPLYALCKHFERYAEAFKHNLEVFDDFESFDPYEYAMRNYGGEIALADDRTICRLVTYALDFLDIRNAKAADIGCGPNPYPAMLLEPHSRSIDLLEYAASNRDFLNRWLAGTLPEEFMFMWRKFEDDMVAFGGSRYDGVRGRLQNTASQDRISVEYGNIFDLPAKKWDIVSSYFVGDSITNQKIVFPQTVRSIRDALTDEGIHIGAYMLNDPTHVGYPAGTGKVFPNISQTATELKSFFIDNDMTCIVVTTGGSDKARDGYDGMALVIAAKRESRISLQLRELQPHLLRLAA